MYFLKNRTTGQKTGFRELGHKNLHKSCQYGMEPYNEEIMIIKSKLLVKLLRKSQKVNFRAQISMKNKIYEVQIF